MRLRCLLSFPLLLLTACSGSELVGVHIAVGKDGSGTITTRSLQPSTAAGPAEALVRGADWKTRAALVSSQGTFRRLSELAFGDGEVRFLSTDEDLPRLRVILRRGPQLAWVAGLTPGEKDRQDLAKVHDPSGKTREIGDVIRLEVQLPDTVISSGVAPSTRGVEADHERNRAHLLLPVDQLLSRGDDLVWDVTWK